LAIDRISLEDDTQLATVLLRFARELTITIWKSRSNPRFAKLINCIDLTFEIINRKGLLSESDRTIRRRRRRRRRRRKRRKMRRRKRRRRRRRIDRRHLLQCCFALRFVLKVFLLSLFLELHCLHFKFSASFEWRQFPVFLVL
jgi:hypothetical protein